MENRFERLTGIVGGTSPAGMEYATAILRDSGAAIALFDYQLGTEVADLARSARVGNKVGGVVFFELPYNHTQESVEVLKQRAEAHFGVPMTQLYNAQEAYLSEPIVPTTSQYSLPLVFP